MTLKEYFATRPHGSITDMAKKLDVTRTWLSLIVNGRKAPSPILCVLIERLTNGKVKRKVLRPDMFI